MTTAAELLAPLRPGLVPVPALQPGVCPVCRTGTKDGFDDCYRCSGSPHRVLPISMSVHGELLHHHLRNYKDGPNEAIRSKFTIRLAALVETFLSNHLDRCLGGGVDLVATVPSPRRDAPWAIVSRLQRFNGFSNVLACDPSGALSVDPAVAGRRVLLLDDTFTTGSSILSAAALLVRNGATIVGPVVVGRHFRPAYEASQALAKCLEARPWLPDRCGICGGEVCNPPLRSSTLF